ncbi:MAG: YchJ family metal-binding protein [Kiritimatiellaeota bacterium]|nr:YchJ family metal-binding protein [Kiritimatiellota bacterium]
MSQEACPCASGKTFPECCEPFLLGHALPATATELMRSRYTAYALSAVDYLHDTSSPRVQKEFDAANTKNWSQSALWTGLEIVRESKGGPGDDTYEWNIGDGNDTIRDTEGLTRVKFGKDVSPEDICIAQDAGGAFLYCLKSHEKIRLEGLTYPYEVLFDDGTVWNQAAMSGMNKAVLGTDGEDDLGSNSRPVTDETVYYIGGKGDDVITGSAYDDTYVWNLGDGNDVISPNAGGIGNRDILLLGTGVLPDEVYISRIENDLCLVIEKTGERITLRNWYASYTSKLTEVRFSDGTAWTTEQMDAMPSVYKGTDGDDVLTGGPADDIMRGGKGDDYLDGGVGNDVYVWNLGDGNDVIKDADNKAAKGKARGSGDRVIFTQERPAYQAKSRWPLDEEIRIGNDPTWAAFHQNLHEATEGMSHD